MPLSDVLRMLCKYKPVIIAKAIQIYRYDNKHVVAMLCFVKMGFLKTFRLRSFIQWASLSHRRELIHLLFVCVEMELTERILYVTVENKDLNIYIYLENGKVILEIGENNMYWINFFFLFFQLVGISISVTSMLHLNLMCCYSVVLVCIILVIVWHVKDNLKLFWSELHSLYFSFVFPRHLKNLSVRPHNLPSGKVLPASICTLFKDFNSYVSCRTSSDCIQHFHHERAFGINRAMGDLGESRRTYIGAVH